MDRSDQPISADEAASLLQWWSDAGVDCLVDEEPRNWLRTRAPALEAPTAPAMPEAAKDELPPQLDLFRSWLADHQDLPFGTPQAPRVCPSGDPASGLMLLVEMPSDEDCATGTLMSGESGRLLDRMLAAMGRSRETIYLASLSCFRTPGGLSGEAGSRCSTLARHHVGLVAPKVLLLLGDACCKAMTGMAVMQARGRWHQIATHSGDIAALASFHPAFLLDRPAAKKHAWMDLQMVMEKLKA